MGEVVAGRPLRIDVELHATNRPPSGEDVAERAYRQRVASRVHEPPVPGHTEPGTPNIADVTEGVAPSGAVVVVAGRVHPAVVDEHVEVLPDRRHPRGRSDLAPPRPDVGGAVPVEHERG